MGIDLPPGAAGDLLRLLPRVEHGLACVIENYARSVSVQRGQFTDAEYPSIQRARLLLSEIREVRSRIR